MRRKGIKARQGQSKADAAVVVADWVASWGQGPGGGSTRKGKCPMLFLLGESICAPCILFWLRNNNKSAETRGKSECLQTQVTGAQTLVKGEKGHLAAEDVLYLTC